MSDIQTTVTIRTTTCWFGHIYGYLFTGRIATDGDCPVCAATKLRARDEEIARLRRSNATLRGVVKRLSKRRKA